MSGNSNGEHAIQSLTVFLIRKFVSAMMFIYVSSQLINWWYTRVFLRIMRDVLRVGNITYTGESLSAGIEMLLSAIWGMISRWFPDSLQQLGDTFLRNAFGTNIHVPTFVSRYGNTMIRIYYTTIIVMIILQIILTLLPYVLMCWWYSKSIMTKMNHLRELDKKRAKEEERKRNLLFSDIVHDVKTPITTIVGYSRAMNDGVIRDEAKKQEYLNSIYMKSLRISELITMLFEFIKLDSAGFTLHQEKLDLAELLRENVIAVYTDFEDKGLELDFDITDDVCIAYADRVQMSRVITNLLTNAIRYSKSGDKAFISMKVMEDEQPYYLISVADSGLEISREFAKTIFEPFSRSDEARQTTSGGSGLGLSIAHKVAEMHGGELRVNLDYGNGYTKAFELVVPVYQEKENT